MEIVGYEMRAAGEPLVAGTRACDGPGADQVLIEVAGCGVCHTDLGFLYDGVPTRHGLPLVLGHEVSGVVVEEGRGVQGWKGESVIVPAVMPCGSCDLCRRGRGAICREQIFPGNDDHGGFASHLVVPARGLCRVPKKSVPRDRLARLSVIADAVSTPYQAIRNSGLKKGDFAIFTGAGGVGGFGIQIAAALGARVLAIDIDAERLEQIGEHGAEWTLNSLDLSPKELRRKVKEIASHARLPPYEWKIFETSGSKGGQETAFSLLNHGAVLSVVGYQPGEVTVRFSNLMAFAARAEGTWGCLPELYPDVLDLVLQGKVAIDPFVEEHPMSSINAIFDKLRRHEMKKRPVLIPDFGAAGTAGARR
jgi:6-hydroxycyclohex-1-ene-1-carbonyl-CoA dehydrogenase